VGIPFGVGAGLCFVVGGWMAYWILLGRGIFVEWEMGVFLSSLLRHGMSLSAHGSAALSYLELVTSFGVMCASWVCVPVIVSSSVNLHPRALTDPSHVLGCFTENWMVISWSI
jgi:hypothetical protein